MQLRKSVLLLLVVAAVLTRFLPHPPNFSPIIALGLFGGAYFSDKRFALLVPISAMVLTDIFLGMHSTLIWVYASLILIVTIGLFLQNRVKISSVIGASLGGAVLFFVITNFGVWMTGTGYHHPMTFTGLIAVYTDAIPFFRNTLGSTLLYSGLLFGAYEIMIRRVPALKAVPVKK